jgi:integral membrane protein
MEVKAMLRNPVGRLRMVGFIEGLSYLLLLFIAMPLKYIADFPMAVTITGGIHGLFFVLFLFALAHVFFAYRQSFWFGVGAIIASLVPFGTFILDKRLRTIEQPVIIVKKHREM